MRNAKIRKIEKGKNTKKTLLKVGLALLATGILAWGVKYFSNNYSIVKNEEVPSTEINSEDENEFDVKKGYTNIHNDEEVMEVAEDIYNEIQNLEKEYDVTAQEIADAMRAFEVGVVSDLATSREKAFNLLYNLLNLENKYGKSMGLYRMLTLNSRGYKYNMELDEIRQEMFNTSSENDSLKRQVALQKFADFFGTTVHDERNVSGVRYIEKLDSNGETVFSIINVQNTVYLMTLDEQRNTYYTCYNKADVNVIGMLVQLDEYDCETDEARATHLFSDAYELMQRELASAHVTYGRK